MAITNELQWTIGEAVTPNWAGRTTVVGRLKWEGFSYIDDRIADGETIAKQKIEKMLIEEFYGDILNWLNDAERIIYYGDIAHLQESIFELRRKITEK